MKLYIHLMTGVALLGLTLLAGTATAQTPAAARAVLEQKGDAVITLEVTQLLKFNWQGQQQENERKLDTIATIIDERGLAVTSLGNIDPSKMIEMYYDDSDAVTASIKSVRYIMPDGTERDAALILRDPDLDLAFLRPLEEPTAPMTHIDLTETSTAGIYDPVFSIERSGRIARRSVLGKQGTIVGIVERPRLIYLPGGDIVGRRMGAPAFTADGKLLGITAAYHFPGGKRALGEDDDPSIAVIRPAVDVAEVARQAPPNAADFALPELTTASDDAQMDTETVDDVEEQQEGEEVAE